MALSTSIALRINAAFTSALDLVTLSAPLKLDFNDSLDSGVAADQADRVFSDTRTVTASANEDLDLAGALLQVDGSAFTPAKLKLIFISAAAGNTNDVLVTRPASNGVPFLTAAGDGFALKPGGSFLLYSPTLAGICSVTAGTGDLINVANSAGGSSVIYSIIIVGTSA
jgi:hypothetical protein